LICGYIGVGTRIFIGAWGLLNSEPAQLAYGEQAGLFRDDETGAGYAPSSFGVLRENSSRIRHLPHCMDAVKLLWENAKRRELELN
jgi:hypothetical protein